MQQETQITGPGGGGLAVSACGVSAGGMVSGNPGSMRHSGFTAETLKLVAIIAMFIDHAAYAFLPNYYAPVALFLHFIGRITGPVMFYFVVEGYHHTRSKNRYTLRMAAFALISYLPFIYFKTGALPTGQNWYTFDVIYTLLLGLLALRVRHEIKKPVLQLVLLALIFAASSFGDWSYLAVLFILLFDFFRGNFRAQAVAYSAVALTRILPSVVSGMFGIVNGVSGWDLYNLFAPALLYCGLFLPLGLLYFYNGRRGTGSKWLFYIFYPAHLVLIGLLHAWLVPVG